MLELITTSGGEPSDVDSELLSVINPTDNGDLEQLLNGLQLAGSLAKQAGQASVSIGAGQAAKAYPKEHVESLRRSINRALAEACRLPSDKAVLEPPFDVDPFRAHRIFLSRMVRSRRSNLPRPSIFTTNYDLVIERALDELGYPYIDGFSGTVDRRLNLAYYGLTFTEWKRPRKRSSRGQREPYTSTKCTEVSTGARPLRETHLRVLNRWKSSRAPLGMRATTSYSFIQRLPRRLIPGLSVLRSAAPTRRRRPTERHCSPRSRIRLRRPSHQ